MYCRGRPTASAEAHRAGRQGRGPAASPCGPRRPPVRGGQGPQGGERKQGIILQACMDYDCMYKYIYICYINNISLYIYI